MDVQHLHQLCADILLRNVFCLSCVTGLQQCLCQSVIRNGTGRLFHFFVHLRLADVRKCPCVGHILSCSADEPIISQCLVILAQGHVGFRTAHVRLNVVRIQLDGFGKGCHSFRIVQFSQILLAQFNFICRIHRL